jgi:hypothetical protein
MRDPPPAAGRATMGFRVGVDGLDRELAVRTVARGAGLAEGCRVDVGVGGRVDRAVAGQAGCRRGLGRRVEAAQGDDLLRALGRRHVIAVVDVAALAGPQVAGVTDAVVVVRGTAETVDREVVLQLGAGVDAMDHPAHVDGLGRRRGGRPPVDIAVVRAVAEHALLDREALAAVQRQHVMADVALVDRDHLAARHRRDVGDGGVVDRVEGALGHRESVVGAVVDHGRAADVGREAPGSGGVLGERGREGHHVLVAHRRGLTRVLGDVDGVVDGVALGSGGAQGQGPQTGDVLDHRAVVVGKREVDRRRAARGGAGDLGPC